MPFYVKFKLFVSSYLHIAMIFAKSDHSIFSEIETLKNYKFRNQNFALFQRHFFRLSVKIDCNWDWCPICLISFVLFIPYDHLWCVKTALNVDGHLNHLVGGHWVCADDRRRLFIFRRTKYASSLWRLEETADATGNRDNMGEYGGKRWGGVAGGGGVQ